MIYQRQGSSKIGRPGAEKPKILLRIAAVPHMTCMHLYINETFVTVTIILNVVCTAGEKLIREINHPLNRKYSAEQ